MKNIIRMAEQLGIEAKEQEQENLNLKLKVKRLEEINSDLQFENTRLTQSLNAIEERQGMKHKPLENTSNVNKEITFEVDKISPIKLDMDRLAQEEEEIKEISKLFIKDEDRDISFEVN